MQEYIKQLKVIQEILFEYLDESTDSEECFINLNQVLHNFPIQRDQSELIEILNLIVSITNNYHRYPTFYDKIIKILLLFKDPIKQTLSNSSIFNIFKSNKRLLLYLVENELFFFDRTIVHTIETEKYSELNYINYFYPETAVFIQNDSEFNQFILSEYHDDKELYMKRRNIGENSHILCDLIRRDSIDEFITYVNRQNLPLSSSTIKPSTFETNSFLLKKSGIHLIEYAAFFGSIQIFKYLTFNGVILNESLWLYVIHGKNPELIHFLEENSILPNDATYKEAYDEAVKCHHNDIANYIYDNLRPNSIEFDRLSSLKYYNFLCMEVDFEKPDVFYYMCKHNHTKLVEILMDTQDVDLTSTFNEGNQI